MRYMLIQLFSFIILLSFSCNKAEEVKTSNVVNKTEISNTNTLTKVIGKLLNKFDQSPTNKYKILVINHTQKELFTLTPDKKGNFEIATKILYENSIYTFHIISNSLNEIAKIDFSSSSGIQNATRYTGGYGFDLGELLIGDSNFGDITKINSAISSKLGGGFKLADTQTYSLETYKAANEIQKLEFSSHLDIQNPETLLNAYYNSDLNTSLYKASLTNNLSLNIAIESTTENYFDEIYLEKAGLWVISSKFIDENGSEIPWSEKRFSLTEQSLKKYSINLKLKKLVTTNTVGYLRILLKAKDYSSFIQPILLKSIVFYPHEITSYNNTAIDYKDSSLKNGLTNPFCLGGTSSEKLSIAAPKDYLGNAIFADIFEQLSISFSYYKSLSDLHQDIKLSVEDSDYNSTYSIDNTVNNTTGEYLWDVSEKTLSINFLPEDLNKSSHDIQLDANLFLSSASGSTVEATKLTLSLKNKTKNLVKVTTILHIDNLCNDL